VKTLTGKVREENQMDLRGTRTKFYTAAMTYFTSTFTHFRQLTAETGGRQTVRLTALF